MCNIVPFLVVGCIIILLTVGNYPIVPHDGERRQVLMILHHWFNIFHIYANKLLLDLEKYQKK